MGALALYIEDEGVPTFRGIGVKRVQDLPLKRWNRMGGNGTFIQLLGTEGLWGCYVVEVPGAGLVERAIERAGLLDEHAAVRPGEGAVEADPERQGHAALGIGVVQQRDGVAAERDGGETPAGP